MFDHFAPIGAGLSNVFSWPNFLIPVLGTVLAMIPAFLPGIGGSSVAALMIILTVTWDPVSVLLLFGALTGGATFMGSITAILFNIPGNASSAAVLLDGYPMARNGRARTAIACAATASAVGSVIGVMLLLALLPAIRPLLLHFGPAERFLFAVWGLTAIIAIPTAEPLKALGATLLGMTLALVGTDPTTSAPRWTFGSFALFEGIGPIVMLLGFFTLAELISWRQSYTLSPSTLGDHGGDSISRGIGAVFRHWGLTIRSALIGTVVGIIPGVGGTVASFIAYGQAARAATGSGDSFGKGDIRGVIAPEAAVDAKDGGSLLPVIAFGLPGSEGGVILLTVLAIHGLTPGTPMLTTELSLVYTLIFALLVSNILTSVLGLGFTPLLARLTQLRIDRIALPVLIVGLVTVVQINGLVVDLYLAAAFGLLGYLFKRFDWPRIPFVIAFVLATFLESNLQLSLQLLAIDRLQPLERPGVLIILGLIALSLTWLLRRSAQPAEPTEPASPQAAAFAAVLLLLVGVMAAASLAGAPAYSGFAQGVVWATVAVLVLILGRAVLAGGQRPAAFLPEAHRLPFFALGLVPVVIWLVGLPLAMAGLVVLWLWIDGLPERPRLWWVALCASLAGLSTWTYLEHVAVIRLPSPVLASLLNAIP